MKNKETIERRREAVQRLPSGWSKRKRTETVQPRDKIWHPIKKCFNTVLDESGQSVSRFYCVIFRSDVSESKKMRD